MITLQLTEAEIQALVALLDAGVKTVGIRGVKEAATLINKIEKAVEETPKE